MSDNLKHFLIALPLTLIIVAGALIGYSGYAYSKLTDTQKEVAGEGDEVKIGLPFEIAGIYPDTESELTTINVNSSFFEGLTKFDKNFRVTPNLAESWNNPDDKTWKIYLKKNVKFHDGTVLKASDVKFTFDYLKEKGYPLSDYLSAVEEVKTVDERTVDIKTKEPYPILMNKLVNIFILSEKNVKEKGIEKPVGTGPYKFVEWKENDHITVERNNDYHGEKPKMKKVTFIPAEDEVGLSEKLNKGEIDITSFYSSTEAIDNAKKNTKLNIKTASDYGVTFFMPNYDAGKAGTNLDKNPLLEKKARQAVYYGIDIEKFILATAKGVATPASQLTTSAVFGYNSEIKRYPYDAEKAKLLLKEAGFENGFEITILAQKGRTKDVEELTQELSKIGVKVKPDFGSSPEEMFGKISEKNYSFILLNWANESGDSSDFIDSILKTDGSSNLSGYSNKEIDDLAVKAASTMDQKKRKEYMGKTLKIVSDEAAFIPLIIQKHHFAFSENLLFEPRADTLIKAEDLAVKKYETVKKPTFIKYVMGKIGL